MLLLKYKKFNIKCYFSGQDYTFGRYGKGNVLYLTEYAKKHNQEHVIVDTFTYQGEKVSTTRVKLALANGDLSLAKQLLIESKISISEISENLNFSSISYFSSVFKKITGKSPLLYRKLIFKDN